MTRALLLFLLLIAYGRATRYQAPLPVAKGAPIQSLLNTHPRVRWWEPLSQLTEK